MSSPRSQSRNQPQIQVSYLTERNRYAKGVEGFSEEMNSQLYQNLKNVPICVLPDKRIRELRQGPCFAIIEDSLRAAPKDPMKKQKFDINLLKNNVQFFEYLNKQAHQSMKPKAKDFYSSSLHKVKHAKQSAQHLYELYNEEEMRLRVEENRKQRNAESKLRQDLKDILHAATERGTRASTINPLDPKIDEEAEYTGQRALITDPSTMRLFSKEAERSTTEKSKENSVSSPARTVELDDGSSPRPKKKKKSKKASPVPPELKLKVRQAIKAETIDPLISREKRKLEVEMLRDYDIDRVNFKILKHSPSREELKPRYRHVEIANKFS